MLEVYWACFIFGVIISLLSILTGDFLSDVLGGAFDALSLDGLDALHPLPVLSGMVIFGVSGIILTENTGLAASVTAFFSVGTATVLSILLHFAYVKPMRRAENSLAYSVRELQGKIGEVSVPIPSSGYGEIKIRVGSVPTYQIAGSFDGEEIPSGTQVVVIEIKDGALYVAAFDPDSDTIQNRDITAVS